MTTQTSDRPLILSTKDESDLLLSDEEKAARATPKEEKAPEPEAVVEKAAEPEVAQPEAIEERTQALPESEMGQADYDELLKFAKSSGFKSVNGLIKSYESSRSWTDRTRAKNKEMEQKISALEERMLSNGAAAPAHAQPVDAEKLKEAFYKAWEENPVEALQSVYDYHTQTKILPAFQRMEHEKELEVSKMAVRQAKKGLKMWGRVENRVKEILEDDNKFQTMSKAAKSIEDKYEVLEMAYERALRLEGIEEPTAPRVTVSSDSSKAPRVETGSDADAGSRLPKKKKSVNDEIADSIATPSTFDTTMARFFGKR